MIRGAVVGAGLDVGKGGGAGVCVWELVYVWVYN